ncbi:MAG TPA: F0F1 ATP synthase subunit delta [Polyangiales bacterium]|jgi:F-type H+-transporting ATPase subunit delta|nr:F0F1 ATP synthase subunit delta [Polyangiales bacterium]
MAELSTIARPYAEAAFRVATADGASLSTWSEQIANLAVVTADPAMRQLVGDPRVAPEQLYGVVAGSLGGSLDPKVENFVRTLIANDRLGVMPEVGAQFARLVDEKAGSAEAEITSAFAMNDADVKDLVGALERKFAIKLKPNVTVDPSLIGGVRVVVGDRVLDTSVRSRLDAMRVQLVA